MLLFIYKSSKVTHVDMSVYICIWGLLGARQEADNVFLPTLVNVNI